VFTLTMPEWLDVSPGNDGAYMQTAIAPQGQILYMAS
jgi:hypothetical protein